MTWISVAAIAVGAYGASQASKAAKAQVGATNAGIALTERQYDQTRKDYAPYRQSGYAGLSKLNEYLGLGGGSYGFGNTIVGPDGAVQSMPTRNDFYKDVTTYERAMGGRGDNWSYGTKPVTKKVFDDAGYQKAMANWEEKVGGLGSQAGGLGSQAGVPQSGDGIYGSLLNPFTGEDLQNEPGYQFQLAEGNKGIDRIANAGGMRDSGATMKALLRFNQDYAGTKFNEAYNRDASQRDRIYNMLAGISGTGQNATAQVASAGANATGNIANLLGQQGNARAAGIVGGANAWNSAIGQGLQYQQNQNMMNWLKKQ